MAEKTSPPFQLTLEKGELVALFRLLNQHQHELREDLRRLERSIEREVYRHFTVEELERLREPEIDNTLHTPIPG